MQDNTYLSNEDDEEKEAVGVHHAFALLDSSATSEEGDHEDDDPEDDDEHGSVEVVVRQEVEIVLGSYLDIGTESDEDQTNQSKAEVEEQQKSLEKAVTAAFHLVEFFFLKKKFKD